MNIYMTTSLYVLYSKHDQEIFILKDPIGSAVRVWQYLVSSRQDTLKTSSVSIPHRKPPALTGCNIWGPPSEALRVHWEVWAMAVDSNWVHLTTRLLQPSWGSWRSSAHSEHWSVGAGKRETWRNMVHHHPRRRWWGGGAGDVSKWN